MTKSMVKIHNAETNEIVEREMNAEEIAQYELDIANSQARLQAQAAKAAEKAALLARLGITAEEATLLLS